MNETAEHKRLSLSQYPEDIRLSWYIAPILKDVYHNIPIRHGLYDMDLDECEYRNPHYQRRVATMADTNPANAPQMNWAITWFERALGYDFKSTTRGPYAGIVGYLNRGADDELMTLHANTDWDNLMPSGYPTFDELRQLYDEFVDSVSTNNGEVIYPPVKCNLISK